MRNSPRRSLTSNWPPRTQIFRPLSTMVFSGMMARRREQLRHIAKCLQTLSPKSFSTGMPWQRPQPKPVRGLFLRCEWTACSWFLALQRALFGPTAWMLSSRLAPRSRRRCNRWRKSFWKSSPLLRHRCRRAGRHLLEFLASRILRLMVAESRWTSPAKLIWYVRHRLLLQTGFWFFCFWTFSFFDQKFQICTAPNYSRLFSLHVS